MKNFIKKISLKNKILSVLLLLAIISTVVQVVFAVAPDPGHTWAEVGDVIVTVAQGGTGLATLTTGNVILGDGTSVVTFVSPATSGNVLTANGTTWTSAAPATTYQTLAADAATNSTTTFATVMATTIGTTGTYAFKYYVRYQSAALTTGVKFQFTFNGAVSSFITTARYQTTGGNAATAATAAADQVTGTAAQLIEGWSVRALKQPLGPSLSVDTINADMLMVIEGIMVVTKTGTFNLQHASEVAAASTVKAGSSLVVTKTN